MYKAKFYRSMPENIDLFSLLGNFDKSLYVSKAIGKKKLISDFLQELGFYFYFFYFQL